MCPDGYREPRLFHDLYSDMFCRWWLPIHQAYKSPEQTQDCLRLSLHTPIPDESATLPVAVWIDSGGFMDLPDVGFQPPTSKAFQGAELCPRVQVIVRHRTGLLGYFPHPKAEVSDSNQGLQDVLAALRWVQENIKAFGGDPTNITICGHGIGADTLLHLLCCRQADGLYARALIQSPLSQAQLLHLKKPVWSKKPAGEAAAEFALKAVETLSSGGKGSDSSNGGIEALRQQSVQQLLAHSTGMSSLQVHCDLRCGPATGASLVEAPPIAQFADAKQAPVPIMIGCGDNDGAPSWDMTWSALPQIPWGGSRHYMTRAHIREIYGWEVEKSLLQAYPGMNLGSQRSNRELSGDAVHEAWVRMLAQGHRTAGHQLFRYRLLSQGMSGFGGDMLLALTGKVPVPSALRKQHLELASALALFIAGHGDDRDDLYPPLSPEREERQALVDGLVRQSTQEALATLHEK